jgi:hypothetical protein
MKRRTFVQASVASLCTVAAVDAAEGKDASEIYELRTYIIKPAKLPLLDEYLSKALIPALKRLGAGPIGVFAEAPEKDLQRLTVLIVHKNGESVTSWPKKIAADEAYLKAGEAYLTAKAADPVYLRIESSVLSAIAGMPKLEKPDTSKPRLLNLRIYESHNERAAAKKVEMFEKGELGIFKRVGLTPVLFASAIAGAQMPNLTYLLVFPDEPGRAAAWNTFRTEPEWLKLKAIPEYADKEIVSKITNKIMTPRDYSEI